MGKNGNRAGTQQINKDQHTVVTHFDQINKEYGQLLLLVKTTWILEVN